MQLEEEKRGRLNPYSHGEGRKEGKSCGEISCLSGKDELYHLSPNPRFPGHPNPRSLLHPNPIPRSLLHTLVVVLVLVRVPNSMKVLLRTPKATQDTGAIGVGVHGAEAEGQSQDRGDGEWQGFVERGVWDEPIIKRWEDVKVSGGTSQAADYRLRMQVLQALQVSQVSQEQC